MPARSTPARCTARAPITAPATRASATANPGGREPTAPKPRAQGAMAREERRTREGARGTAGASAPLRSVPAPPDGAAPPATSRSARAAAPGTAPAWPARVSAMRRTGAPRASTTCAPARSRRAPSTDRASAGPAPASRGTRARAANCLPCRRRRRRRRARRPRRRRRRPSARAAAAEAAATATSVADAYAAAGGRARTATHECGRRRSSSRCRCSPSECCPPVPTNNHRVLDYAQAQSVSPRPRRSQPPRLGPHTSRPVYGISRRSPQDVTRRRSRGSRTPSRGSHAGCWRKRRARARACSAVCVSS